MPSQSTHDFTKLQAAFDDGQLANALYRRQQLANLHQKLVDVAPKLATATANDTAATEREALAEIYLTLKAIKSYHDDIAPEKELQSEYSVAQNRDAAHIRRGLGVVGIQCQSHTMIYSLLVPLAAAIAAGNPVAVKLEQTLQHLPGILRDLLQDALDSAIFDVVQSVAQHLPALLVDQIRHTKTPSIGVLASPSASISVAVVDRTAHVDQVGKLIRKARTAFGGTSPYAPDIVLVNEFVRQDLLNALAIHPEQLNVGNAKENGNGVVKPQQGRQQQLPPGQVCVDSTTYGSIFEVTDRSYLSGVKKSQDRKMQIHTFRSLDDAIEILDDLSKDCRFLATYAFGDPQTAKYILQFARSDAGFANLIPTEILVGPAAPRGNRLELSPRYSTEWFSAPYPQFSQTRQASLRLDQILSDNFDLRARGMPWEELRLEGRRPVRHIPGYFERSALIGVSTIGILVLGLGTASVLGLRTYVGRYFGTPW